MIFSHDRHIIQCIIDGIVTVVEKHRISYIPSDIDNLSYLRHFFAGEPFRPDLVSVRKHDVAF